MKCPNDDQSELWREGMQEKKRGDECSFSMCNSPLDDSSVAEGSGVRLNERRK